MSLWGTIYKKKNTRTLFHYLSTGISSKLSVFFFFFYDSNLKLIKGKGGNDKNQREKEK